jgi:hypothetical protein
VPIIEVTLSLLRGESDANGVGELRADAGGLEYATDGKESV